MYWLLLLFLFEVVIHSFLQIIPVSIHVKSGALKNISRNTTEITKADS